MLDVSGKTVLLTGGARGLGAEAAKKLAAGGAKIFLTDVLDEPGAATVQEIKDAGGEATFFHHDVTSESDWQAAVEACVETYGALDVLVNNAGILIAGSVVDEDYETFRKQMAVNVDGVFLGMKTAIPAMEKSAGNWKGGGSIINLSSVAGLIGAANLATYCATKGAVKQMTKAVALDCAGAGRNIRINTVHPAIIETDMGDQLADEVVASGIAGNTEEGRGLLTLAHPIGRLGQPKDVASAVLFLASDSSAYMTGSQVLVDGGFTAR